MLIARRQEGGASRSAPLAVWPLLEAVPLEEVHVFPLEPRPGRSLQAHQDALARWEVLRRHGGPQPAGSGPGLGVRW